MNATILTMPRGKRGVERLAFVGDVLAASIPTAASDPELDLLLKIGGKLLDNLQDYQAVDVWLARLDKWEGKNPR